MDKLSIILAVLAGGVAVLTLVLNLTGVFYPRPLVDLKKEFDQFKDVYRDKHEELANRVSRLEGKLNGK